VLALIKAESNFDGSRVSRKGAVGIMQLMPGTAQELGVNPADLEENIKGGIQYLSRLKAQFGSLPLVVAAYNAGPEAVVRAAGVPPYPETRAFVSAVLGYYGRKEFPS
jgi:soluble lytic murein transglycosylase-like protein